jgi:hypothetical protein
VSLDQGELEPAVLRLATSDGQVLVTWGHALVYRYEIEDIGMRNRLVSLEVSPGDGWRSLTVALGGAPVATVSG